MHRTPLSLVVAFVIASACSGAEPTPNPGSPAVAGRWTYQRWDVREDTCGARAVPGFSVLEYPDAPAAFELRYDDLALTLSCTRAGDVFDCAPATAREDLRPRHDADLVTTASDSGLVDGADRMRGELRLDRRCEGGGCRLYTQSSRTAVPCTTVVDWEAVRQ